MRFVLIKFQALPLTNHNLAFFGHQIILTVNAASGDVHVYIKFYGKLPRLIKDGFPQKTIQLVSFMFLAG